MKNLSKSLISSFISTDIINKIGILFIAGGIIPLLAFVLIDCINNGSNLL